MADTVTRLPPVASIDGVELTAGEGPDREDVLALRYRDLDGQLCETRMGRADSIHLRNILLLILAKTGTPVPTREEILGL